MRALTIRQPWAHCIFSKVWIDGPDGLEVVESKRVENRPMSPPASLAPVNGRPGEVFAVHTSQKPDQESIADLTGRRYALPAEWPKAADTPARHRKTTALGAVIGVARIERVVTQERWSADLPAGQIRWWIGPYGWLLCDVVALPTPIPCNGQLAYGWRLPDDVEERVLEGWGKVDA